MGERSKVQLFKIIRPCTSSNYRFNYTLSVCAASFVVKTITFVVISKHEYNVVLVAQLYPNNFRI